MRWLLQAGLAVLVPAVALAEGTPLTGIEQVRGLCEALGTSRSTPGEPLARAQAEGPAKEAHDRALQQELVVTLRPGEFRIADADVSSGTLTVDTARAFRLFKGQVVFYTVDDEDLDLAVPEGAGLPRNTGELTLELTVRPGQDTEPGCTVGLSKDYVVGVEVLSAQLRDRKGAVVARLDEDPSRDRLSRPGGKPVVEIDPALTEGAGPLARQVGDGMQQLKPRLVQCYQASLGVRPSLDGTLVLGFEFTPGGKPGPVTLVADSVQDEALARCVTQAVSELALSKARKGEKVAAPSGRASVSVRFERK
jgi:hypothetical protein